MAQISSQLTIPHYLQDLNPQQREAVECLSGPVLVVAGAGTGKTRVITCRILHILNTVEGISPEQILPITFSRKASEEMQERICRETNSFANNLSVFTFHGFCYQFIQDNSHNLGFESKFKLLDNVGQFLVLKQILAELDFSYYEDKINKIQTILSFLKFISKAQTELCGPQQLKQYIDSYIEDEQSSLLWNELYSIYNRYEKFKNKENYLDFGDLIYATVKTLKQNKTLLNSYQDRFKYILVDEFQDTNIAQIELIRLVSGKHKNICVVGDDDQSIYRFRGASFASFIKFNEIFPRAKLLRLSENYRSTKNILFVSEKFIKYNEPDRFDPNKALMTNNPKGEKVHIITSPDFQEEAYSVAQKIKEIYEAGPVEKRKYSDFAVLYRAHAHKEYIVKVFHQMNIPFIITSQFELFKEDLAKDIIAFFHAINNLNDGVNMFWVFTLPCFEIDYSDVVALLYQAKDKHRSLYQIIFNTAQLKGVSDQSRKKIENLKNIISELVVLSYKKDVIWLLDYIMKKTAYMSWINNNRPDKLDRELSVYARFRKFIFNFENVSEKRDLKSFLEYLDAYHHIGGSPIDIDKSEETDAVQCMTIHQSKGLEFNYVFLINLVRSRFPSMKKIDKPAFPVELMKEALPKGDYHLQEERRLFYVALTRARTKLILSTVEKGRVTASKFIQEILKIKDIQSAVECANNVLDKKQSSEYILKSLSTGLKSAERIQQFDKITITPLQMLSYSQIEMYEACALKYKFAYGYKIPVQKPPYLIFGQIIHKILEQYARSINDNHPVCLEEIVTQYHTLFDRAGFTDKLDIKRYKFPGEKMIRDFYRNYNSARVKTILLEESFALDIENYKIKGVIDRVDALDEELKEVEVIDYKTGAPKDIKSANRSLQLSIYAIAMQQLYNFNPVKLSFYNLTNQEKVTVSRSPEDLETAKRQIIQIAEKIKNNNYEPSPSYSTCRYCDYCSICPYVYGG